MNSSQKSRSKLSVRDRSMSTLYGRKRDNLFLLGRFFSHLNKVVPDNNGCWVWSGYSQGRNKNSQYGRLYYKNSLVLAHRFFYQEIKGDIKKGMTLDHLCKNTLCCNPDHLEQVSLRENVRRGADRRVVCKRGHSIDNFVEYATRQGIIRTCRLCINMRSRALYRKSR